LFRQQTGSNLLVVGQNEQLALGAISTGMIGLSAQLAVCTTTKLKRFYVLDGTRPDAPEAGFWSQLSNSLPLEAKVAQPGEAARLIGELASEVERRLSVAEPAPDSIFLVIHNLARFRDLKKADDYSFDEKGGAGPGTKLATILREGPAVGIHTLVWCDSFNNVNRWIDRQALRDFDMRVLFQMSAGDSSNLMDSPAASRLGAHTAILYSEERGHAEKFRPYGMPSHAWLAAIGQALTRRTNQQPDRERISPAAEKHP
jgi:hypothetical protein